MVTEPKCRILFKWEADLYTALSPALNLPGSGWIWGSREGPSSRRSRTSPLTWMFLGSPASFSRVDTFPANYSMSGQLVSSLLQDYLQIIFRVKISLEEHPSMGEYLPWLTKPTQRIQETAWGLLESLLTASREWSMSWSSHWPHCITCRRLLKSNQNLNSFKTMWERRGSGDTVILDRRELDTSRGFGFLQ